MAELTLTGLLYAVIIAAIVGFVIKIVLGLFDATKPYADAVGVATFLLTLLITLF